ncbi:MAG: hypothetical protein COA42_12075 [Alteromonadaceae bacterium]|nr:MAG: hypothetical protein COA42_12075 [Alteromonadaceae bacterium]
MRLIDPKVDCVFKSIFGVQEHAGLLVGFLNGVLKPVTSIWLLAENLFDNTQAFHYHFQMADLQQQQVLSDHKTVDLAL